MIKTYTTVLSFGSHICNQVARIRVKQLNEDVLPDVGEEDGEATAGGLLVQFQVLSLEYKVFCRL